MMKRFALTLVCLLSILGIAYGVHAQTAEQKYATIVIDETTTSKPVEDVARSLMSEDLAFHEKATGGSEPKIYAVYDSLNTEDKYAGLIVQLYGPTACAAQGCDTYVFRRIGKNQWQQALKTTADQVWRDKAHKPADIATQGGNAPAILWRWDGKRAYERVQ